MLFNSVEFLFVFLPVTALLAALLSALRQRTVPTMLYLSASSIFFFGWWNPNHIPLLCASIIFNFLLAGRMALAAPVWSKRLLVLGIAVNLITLCFFKYLNFFAEQAGLLIGMASPHFDIVLPLAISFVTFHQISYLVYVYRTGCRATSLLQFFFYISFFPHLLAGPIFTWSNFYEQTGSQRFLVTDSRNLLIGTSIFAVGLAKKVLLADHLGNFADPVFAAVGQGAQLTMIEAWGGALCFCLQIYFDFSGYSDMAIGLGRMFGVRLPVNFFSPYKALNIVDFWRRWHITLSQFLRDHLYIPLGGSRRSILRQWANVAITMLLGGLWHGANWTFVFWGGVHGLMIVATHAYWEIRRPPTVAPSRVSRALAWLGTFGAVTLTWVLFRAETLPAAWSMIGSMLGLNGIAMPTSLAGHLPKLPLVSYSGMWPNQVFDFL